MYALARHEPRLCTPALRDATTTTRETLSFSRQFLAILESRLLPRGDYLKLRLGVAKLPFHPHGIFEGKTPKCVQPTAHHSVYIRYTLWCFA